MGIVCNTYYCGVKGAIWRLSESREELLKRALDRGYNASILDGLTLEKKCRERLAAHILLSDIIGESLLIRHDTHGRPVVDNVYISVSHSPDYLYLAVSDSRVGVDVERVGDRQLSLAEKFLSSSEMQWMMSVEDKRRYASLLWSVKEAVFKLAAQDVLSFSKGITIPQFSIDDSETIDAFYLLPSGKSIAVKAEYALFANDALAVTAVLR